MTDEEKREHLEKAVFHIYQQSLQGEADETIKSFMNSKYFKISECLFNALLELWYEYAHLQNDEDNLEHFIQWHNSNIERIMNQLDS